MKVTTAVTIVALAMIAMAPAANAATAPGTARRYRANSKEVFELKVVKVFLEEKDGKFKDVIMEAVVSKVVRSASDVKKGDTIVIRSRRRYMTNDQLRDSVEAFSEAPQVIKTGWTGSAYLRAKNTTDSVKSFGVILEGFSFLSK